MKRAAFLVGTSESGNERDFRTRSKLLRNDGRCQRGVVGGPRGQDSILAPTRNDCVRHAPSSLARATMDHRPPFASDGKDSVAESGTSDTGRRRRRRRRFVSRHYLSPSAPPTCPILSYRLPTLSTLTLPHKSRLHSDGRGRAGIGDKNVVGVVFRLHFGIFKTYSYYRNRDTGWALHLIFILSPTLPFSPMSFPCTANLINGRLKFEIHQLETLNIHKNQPLIICRASWMSVIQ